MKRILMVVVAAGLLGSCTWIDKVLGRAADILADLDIQDAVALFASLAQQAGESVNELYKLTGGGISFDIITMVVAPDGTVTFNALRLSDGIRVIGSVASDGTVTILDEALNAEVISLERLQ